jgi:DNA-binding CsgD family transcriptional regulator
MAAPQDVGSKMDALIRLTALQLIGDKTGAEAIALLGRSGLDNEVIALVVGTTPATVRATLSRVRRSGTLPRKSTLSSLESTTSSKEG